jgi:hypothetical protein
MARPNFNVTYRLSGSCPASFCCRGLHYRPITWIKPLVPRGYVPVDVTTQWNWCTSTQYAFTSTTVKPLLRIVWYECELSQHTRNKETFTWKACLTIRALSEHLLWFLKHRHNFNIPFQRTLRCQAGMEAQWHGMQWRAGRFILHRNCSFIRGLFDNVVSNLNYIILSRCAVLCVFWIG